MPEKARLQGGIIIIRGGWGFTPAVGSFRSSRNRRNNFPCGNEVCEIAPHNQPRRRIERAKSVGIPSAFVALIE